MKNYSTNKFFLSVFLFLGMVLSYSHLYAQEPRIAYIYDDLGRLVRVISENDATGLYYYRARYYHPQLQRFMSEDPLDLSEVILLKQLDPSDIDMRSFLWELRLEPQLLHPTGYVLNSPVNYSDPSGEFVPQLVGCGIGAGISIGMDLMSGKKIDWLDATIGCGLGALGGAGWSSGWELKMGKNLRLAPFGNRTGNPYGRWPHYHRKITDASGKTVPGGSMRWHRPWEKGF